MNLMLSRKNAMSWRFLKVYRERYDTLERACWLLKEERDSSLEKVPESSKKLAVVVDQKEKHFEGFEHWSREKGKSWERDQNFQCWFCYLEADSWLEHNSTVYYHAYWRNNDSFTKQNSTSLPLQCGRTESLNVDNDWTRVPTGCVRPLWILILIFAWPKDRKLTSPRGGIACLLSLAGFITQSLFQWVSTHHPCSSLSLSLYFLKYFEGDNFQSFSF